MRILILIALAFLTIVVDNTYGQRRIIPFKCDTIQIANTDTVYYKKGNDIKGEVKYGKINGAPIVVLIDSGYIIKRTCYFLNGQKEFEANYRKGLFNGIIREWDEKGILIYIGHYFNGFADSTWTFYYSNGSVESKGDFLPDMTRLICNFELNQSRLDFYTGDPVGQISLYEKFSPPNGIWTFYNKQGEIIKKIGFDKGVIKSITVGDHD